jgi:UDP-glucose 4-epimerase
LNARRSLLALDNLAAAIETVLTASGSLRRPLIVADREALTAAQMVAAMRRGLGRRPGVFPFSPWALGNLLRVTGKEEVYRRLSGSLVAHPSALAALGWAPRLTTWEGLGRLMQES